MTAVDQKRTRLERAAEAFEAAERERHDSPPDLERCRGQLPDEFVDQLKKVAALPRRYRLAEQMERLRIWAVYIAAREQPLLEALSTFTVERVALGRDWEMRCATVFPGHRQIGDNLRYVASWRLDPTVMMMPGDWEHYARTEIGIWLRIIEGELANRLVPG